MLVKMQIPGSHFISPELQILRGRSQESALSLESSQDLTYRFENHCSKNEPLMYPITFNIYTGFTHSSATGCLMLDAE